MGAVEVRKEVSGLGEQDQKGQQKCVCAPRPRLHLMLGTNTLEQSSVNSCGEEARRGKATHYLHTTEIREVLCPSKDPL